MTDQAAIRAQFWTALDSSPFLMVALAGEQQHSLPMTAQLDRHANHAFWFYTSRDNRLAPGGAAMAQFVSRGHDLFACIAGTLSAETDPAIIDRYWSKQVAAWYPGGRDDPSLLMLRFDLGDAEIWQTDVTVKGLFRLLTGGDILGAHGGRHTEVTL